MVASLEPDAKTEPTNRLIGLAPQRGSSEIVSFSVSAKANYSWGKLELSI